MTGPTAGWVADPTDWVDTSASWLGFDVGPGTVVWDELAQIAVDLGTVGIPAVPSPDDVLPWLAELPVAALVGVPTVSWPTIGRGVIELDVPVHLVTKPPADLHAMQALWTALPRAGAVLRPWEPAQPDPLTVGTITVPGYTVRTRRHIEE